MTKKDSRKRRLTTYIFLLKIDRSNGMWYARVPGLEKKGAVGYGSTRSMAIGDLQRNIQLHVGIAIAEGKNLARIATKLDTLAVTVTV